ncbi:MAG: hypothetical protein IKH19_02685 [Muribaculaceae bacterium]|nr:hypothetical protein [Muribaculaceae bacterium]
MLFLVPFSFFSINVIVLGIYTKVLGNKDPGVNRDKRYYVSANDTALVLSRLKQLKVEDLESFRSEETNKEGVRAKITTINHRQELVYWNGDGIFKLKYLYDERSIIELYQKEYDFEESVLKNVRYKTDSLIYDFWTWTLRVAIWFCAIAAIYVFIIICILYVIIFLYKFMRKLEEF